MQVDDGGFAAFYQAQFGDCMTQQCLEKLLANRLPTRITALAGLSGAARAAASPCKSAPVPTSCYDFSADLQAVADGTTSGPASSGTITMVKEDGALEGL